MYCTAGAGAADRGEVEQKNNTRTIGICIGGVDGSRAMCVWYMYDGELCVSPTSKSLFRGPTLFFNAWDYKSNVSPVQFVQTQFKPASKTPGILPLVVVNEEWSMPVTLSTHSRSVEAAKFAVTAQA